MKAILYKGSDPLNVRMIADSAISRDVMPLFVPDIPTEWMAKICPAVRVRRMGKSISPRFVARHLDAFGAVAVLEPTGKNADILENSGVLSILDNCVTTGRWIERTIAPADRMMVEARDGKVEIHIAGMEVEKAVSEISRYSTLKTGDIVMLAGCALDIPLVIDDTIKVDVNGVECLHIKVK